MLLLALIPSSEMLELVPMERTIKENHRFIDVEECREALCMTIEYYKSTGFYPPWIGYFAAMDGKLVGSAGIKGRPINNKIEIAYGTFPKFRKQGIGTEICRQLVTLGTRTNPLLTITARTLPEHSYSTKILEKNGFQLLGEVWDKDDGNVWEWQYSKDKYGTRNS